MSYKRSIISRYLIKCTKVTLQEEAGLAYYYTNRLARNQALKHSEASIVSSFIRTFPLASRRFVELYIHSYLVVIDRINRISKPHELIIDIELYNLFFKLFPSLWCFAYIYNSVVELAYRGSFILNLLFFFLFFEFLSCFNFLFELDRI